MQHVLADLQ